MIRETADEAKQRRGSQATASLSASKVSSQSRAEPKTAQRLCLSLQHPQHATHALLFTASRHLLHCRGAFNLDRFSFY